MFRQFSIVVGVFASLAFASPTQASFEGTLNHNSGFMVNPDFNSGYANGWGGGMNAVITHVQIGISYDINEITHVATINAYASVSGVWGDPASNNPYFDFMSNTGLHANAQQVITTTFWNGKWWEFSNPLVANLNLDAYLFRNEEHTSMTGWTSAYANFEGAIPVSSSSWGNIFAPGHPSDVPDFEMMFNFSAVTSDFHEVAAPAPGALALLGIAGLVGRRRRNS